MHLIRPQPLLDIPARSLRLLHLLKVFLKPVQRLMFTLVTPIVRKTSLKNCLRIGLAPLKEVKRLNELSGLWRHDSESAAMNRQAERSKRATKLRGSHRHTVQGDPPRPRD